MIRSLWFKGLSCSQTYRRLVLLERMVNQPLPDVTAARPVRVSVLAEGEIGAYLALRPDQDRAEIRRRLEDGQRCFAVWHDRQIIHVTWAATGRATIEYLTREIALAPDEAYAYDGFTSRAFRGLGVAAVRSVEMIRYFRDRGYRRLLGLVHPENRSAFGPVERVGYRRIGVIGYIGLGPWRRAFCRMDRGASRPGSC